MLLIYAPCTKEAPEIENLFDPAVESGVTRLSIWSANLPNKSGLRPRSKPK